MSEATGFEVRERERSKKWRNKGSESTMDGEGQHIKQQIDAAFGDDYESLYSLMSLSTSATTEEIKRSYRRLALKHHPDRGGDAEKFKALSVSGTNM